MNFRSFFLLSTHILYLVSAFHLFSTAIFFQEHNGREKTVNYFYCGTYRSEDLSPRKPAFGGGLLIAAEEGGRLRGLETETLETAWTAELGGTIVSDLLVVGERLYVVSNPAPGPSGERPDSILRTLNVSTGLPLSTFKLTFAERYFLGTTDQKLIAVGSGGTVLAIEPTLDKAEWVREFSPPVLLEPSISAQGVVLVAGGWRILMLDAETGAVTAEHISSNDLTAVSTNGSGSFFLADSRGSLERIDPGRSRPVWRFKAGASISGLETESGAIYFTSLDNFVYKVSSDSGSVAWRRRVPNRLLAAPNIVNGHLFISGIGDSEVFMVDRGSGKFVNKLPLAENELSAGFRLIVSNGAVAVPVSGGFAIFSDQACSSEK